MHWWAAFASAALVMVGAAGCASAPAGPSAACQRDFAAAARAIHAAQREQSAGNPVGAIAGLAMSKDMTKIMREHGCPMKGYRPVDGFRSV